MCSVEKKKKKKKKKKKGGVEGDKMKRWQRQSREGASLDILFRARINHLPIHITP